MIGSILKAVRISCIYLTYPETDRIRVGGNCFASTIMYLLLVTTLTSCSRRLAPPRGDATPIAPRNGGHITIATMSRPRSLDPALAFDEASDPIVRLLHARLFQVSRSGQIRGDLVRDYTMSPDGLTLTMHLREDAFFHDGAKVYAHDIVRSMLRAFHPEAPCPTASFFDIIEGFSDYRKAKASFITGIQALSDETLRIQLSRPDATVLPILTLATVSPVCPSTPAIRVHTLNALNVDPCGAGPFRAIDYNPSESITLERHRSYHRANDVHLSEIRWIFGVAPSSQRYRFELGQLDLVHELTTADAVAFRTDTRWKALGHWTQARSTRGAFMNTLMAPFNDIRVRQAVSLAIDRKQIASLRAGHLVVANSVIPSGVVGYDPFFPGVQTDTSKALSLMKQAGFAYDPATGRGGYPYQIDYYCAAESLDVSVAELLQQQLHNIGLRIQIKAMAWPAYLAITSQRKRAQMGADGWGADFDDPSDFFDPLFSSRSITEAGSQNRAFYSNPELDYLLDQARQSTDVDTRKRMYRKADTIVRDEAPWAVLFSSRYYDIHQGYVHGYLPHPYAYLDVAGLWVDETERKLSSSTAIAPFLNLRTLALQLRTSLTSELTNGAQRD